MVRTSESVSIRTDPAASLVPLVVGVGDPGEWDVLGHDRRRQGLVIRSAMAKPSWAVVDPSRILQCRFGLDGSEGDDLGHAVAAPLVGGVAHHLPRRRSSKSMSISGADGRSG